MKTRSKILATWVAALSLMALSAPGAQALEFRLESGTSLAGETISSASTEAVTLGAAGVTVTCTSATGTGTLAAGAATTALVSKFKGCSANKTCTVPSEIVTNTAQSSSSESGAIIRWVVTPTGKTFVEITFGGAECALAGKQPVTGSACAEGPAKGTYQVEQLSSTPTEACASSIKVGANAATLKIKGVTKLSGANTGKKWGIT